MTHGATPEPGLDSIATLVSGAAPEMWVVALGTNDIGAETDPQRYGGDVQRLLDEIPAASSVVWVDVWIRDRKSAVERANQVLRDVLAERPRSMVADWFSHGDDVGVVTADGVHLTGDGRHVFAATIVDAILALSS
jgi:lysophospholipase L1-like esterase